MAIRIETILTDDAGNRIVVSQEYREEKTLLDKNVDEIEALILKAKTAIGQLAECELLKENQRAYTEKKNR
jgi:hypothetical protein